MKITESKFDWRDRFQEAADSGNIEALDEEIMADTRSRIESGEILQRPSYGSLPDSPEDAFKETSLRESEVINKAMKKLGERRNI